MLRAADVLAGYDVPGLVRDHVAAFGGVDAVCYLVFFFPPLLIFLDLSWDYFLRSFAQNERIVTSPWLPIVWPFKFVMPLSAALLLVQGLSEFLKSIQAAFGKEIPDAPPGPIT